MLELDEAVKYVGAAYAVFLALLVIYVAIIAVRMDRLRGELAELADLAESRSGAAAGTRDDAGGREAEQPREYVNG